MKKISTAFAFIVCSLGFITACKKNNTPPDKKATRLAAVKSNEPDSFRLNYLYDAQGRIYRITSQANSTPPTTFFDITYSASQVVIVEAPLNLTGQKRTDTIYLFTDGTGRVMKRVMHSYREYSPPNNTERAWYADTTTNTYDANGFLTSQLLSKYDTVWYNDGSPRSSTMWTLGEVAYTVTSNNLVKSFEVDHYHQIDRTVTSMIIDDRSDEFTKSLDYSQSYANSTDFSNVAIINEANYFGEVPVNKSYKNFTNHIDRLFVTKDQNGNVTGTYPSKVTYQFTYNADGLVSSRFDSEVGVVYTFVYEAP